MAFIPYETTGIIDGGSISFLTAWHYREENVEDEHVINKLHKATDRFMEALIGSVKMTRHIGFLDGKKAKQFRYKVFNGYKKTRREQPKPVHSEHMKVVNQRLVNKWNFYYPESDIHAQYEADDLVLSYYKWAKNNGIPRPVVVSKDKDLKTKACLFYDLSTREPTNVSSEDAYFNYCLQMLTGDKADDIPGLKMITNETKLEIGFVKKNGEPKASSKVGPATATHILTYCIDNNITPLDYIRELYQRQYKNPVNGLHDFHMNYLLLNINDNLKPHPSWALQ